MTVTADTGTGSSNSDSAFESVSSELGAELSGVSGGDVSGSVDSNSSGVDSSGSDSSNPGGLVDDGGTSAGDLSSLGREAVDGYGFAESLVKGKDDSFIKQLMVDHDRAIIGSPHSPQFSPQNTLPGFQGNQNIQSVPGSQAFPGSHPGQAGFGFSTDAAGGQDASQLPPPLPQHDQQAAGSSQAVSPEFDLSGFDDDARVVLEGFQQQNSQLSGQLQQMQGMFAQLQQSFQQLQMQPMVDSFEAAVSGLESDFFGTGRNLNQQQNIARDQLWGTVLSLGDSLERQGMDVPAMENLVERAVRALQYDRFVDQESLIEQARSQSGQIAGQPVPGDGHEVRSLKDQALDNIQRHLS